MTRRDGLSLAELLDLVDADPHAAMTEARRRLDAQHPGLAVSARLHWVIGLVDRARGDFESARASLVTACRLATETTDSALLALVQVSLSFVVARLGDLDEALRILEAAEPHLDGADHARLLSQQGTILFWKGDVTSALIAMDQACDELREHGDRLGELRVLVNVGGFRSQIGQLDTAADQLSRAIDIAHAIDQPVVKALAEHNLGFASARRGDLTGALALFQEAEAGMIAGGSDSYLPNLHVDHADALVAAGLLDDAAELLGRALLMLAEHGNDIDVAGALVTAAEIKLALGDLAGASAAAESAEQRYRDQGRDPWVAVATHLALQVAARSGDGDVAVADALDENATALTNLGLSDEATRARLVAALVRVERGDRTAEQTIPAAVRAAARRGRASDRVLLAYVDAVSAVRRGDSGTARRAITRGLNTVMESQAALGSIEMRAHAAVHGSALLEIGARLAIADGRPLELLARIEATRLMQSRLPSVRPPADPELATMLTGLRQMNATVESPTSSEAERKDAQRERARLEMGVRHRTAPVRSVEAERQRTRLEHSVRHRSRTARGTASAPVDVTAELAAALALLGDRQLLAHAALDGRLFAVSVTRWRARLHELGPINDISSGVDAIVFALHRLNRSQGSEASRVAAAELLYASATDLGDLLLPADVAESFDPVVVVPTALLHNVPWGLLPALTGRPVSVNPSVSAWAMAERSRVQRSASGHARRVGLVAGPDLEFAEVEVRALSAMYDEPVVLAGDAATGNACLELLQSCDLVHIACHGSLRTDNPMFSALHLADGPLNVYDFETLDRLPEVVVLSACSVAGGKTLQGGSLLGLAGALTTFGANSVIAPLTPISDASAVTVMQRLHQSMVGGTSPAAALAAAAITHDITDPTAASFITMGA